MVYSALADLLVLLHFAFIIFIMGGALLFLRWSRAPLLHIPAAVWGAFVELAGQTCPLTPLEIDFRTRAGQAGYQTSFIDHYLVPIVYPQGLTPHAQCAVGILVVLANVILYGLVLRVRMRAGRSHEP